MEGADAVGADADDADGNLEFALKKIEIGDEVWGELGGVGDLGEVGVPAGESDVLGGDSGEFTRVR